MYLYILYVFMWTDPKSKSLNFCFLYFVCSWLYVMGCGVHSVYLWLSPCFYFSNVPHTHPFECLTLVCVSVCAPVLHYKDSCLFSVLFFIPKLAAQDSSVQHFLFNTHTGKWLTSWTKHTRHGVNLLRWIIPFRWNTVEVIVTCSSLRFTSPVGNLSFHDYSI